MYSEITGITKKALIQNFSYAEKPEYSFLNSSDDWEEKLLACKECRIQLEGVLRYVDDYTVISIKDATSLEDVASPEHVLNYMQDHSLEDVKHKFMTVVMDVKLWAWDEEPNIVIDNQRNKKNIVRYAWMICLAGLLCVTSIIIVLCGTHIIPAEPAMYCVGALEFAFGVAGIIIELISDRKNARNRKKDK